jgi:hypothetical protein
VIRGGVRSLNARLARLEQQSPEPQGRVVYQVVFHDGTPVYPKPGEDPTVPLIPSGLPGGVTKIGNDLIYRITMVEVSELDTASAGVAP